MPEKSSSLLVAPWIEVWSLREWITEPHSAALFERNGITLGQFLDNFLDTLQAKLSSTARLGYMVSINVYELYAKDSEGRFYFDPSRMEFFTNLFRSVSRPVVVNLRANHFVGDDPQLIGELSSHESSFALLTDGSPVRVEYYQNAVFAPNFSLDEDLPLNHYRFGGFRQAAAILAEFDRAHPGVIHAITLAGEIHHFLPELADPQAAGQFEGARMTDYSPQSIRDFAAWLRTRHGTVEAMNAKLGTAFGSWDEIEPPRCDLNTEPDHPAWSHMDSYANGLLPVFGWLRPPLDGVLRVYIDGEPLVVAEYGLSRLDVYDAVPDMADSDVGFRVDIDYRGLAPGPHVLHVLLEKPNGERFRVGDRRLMVAGEMKGPVPVINVNHLNRLPDCSGFGWLDHPRHDLGLRFNPYAAEWQEFREYQVDGLVSKFSDLAIKAGLPREKLFSHQIMPQFEGSWNRVAFAVPGSPSNRNQYYPGVNLYGGSAVYRSMRQYLNGIPYGVPELHPRMGKSISRDVFLRTLEYHADVGASFVCPYFMALREPIGQRATADPDNRQDALLIHQLNAAVGSMHFYSAIVKFLSR